MKKLLFFLPLLMFFIIGCTVEEPGTPKWQVEMTIPIADEQYSMIDMVADSAEIDSTGNWVSINGDTLIFNFADSMDRIDIENQLTLDEFAYLIENYVEVRSVEAPGLETALYLLDDVAPSLLPFIGQSVPVNPFSFDTGKDLGSFPEFDWVIAESGDVTVTVVNNMPVPMYNLDLEILGKTPTNPQTVVVHTFIPGPLQPGETYIEVNPLPYGVEIDNEMEVFVSGNSPGSTLPVFIDAEANLTVDVEISEMGVYSAVAQIPGQIFDADTTFSLEQENVVESAVVREGFLNFTVTNNTNLINTITFVLPDFTLDGIAFTRVFDLGPHQSLTYADIDLEGYIMSRPQMDNMVQALVDCDILNSENPEYIQYGVVDGYLFVDQNQLVTTDFDMSDLIFASFSGILDTVDIDIDQDPVELEGIPGGLETINMQYANIDLNIYNSIGLPLEVFLTVSAIKDGIIKSQFIVPGLVIPPGDTIAPTLLDTTITGLETIVEAVPSEINITGVARVYGQVDVNELQWIDIEYCIYTPFSIGVDTTTLEPPLTKITDGFENKLEQIDLNLYLTSHMPLSGEAYILASYDSNAFNTPGIADVDTFMHAVLPTAVLGPQGYVIDVGELTSEQTLTEDQLNMFADAKDDNPLYIKTLIVLFSTQGQLIYFRPDDYLTVGASAHAIVNVDLEEGGN